MIVDMTNNVVGSHEEGMTAECHGRDSTAAGCPYIGPFDRCPEGLPRRKGAEGPRTTPGIHHRCAAAVHLDLRSARGTAHLPWPRRRGGRHKKGSGGFTRARSILFIIFHDLAWFRQRRSAHLIDCIGAAYCLFEKRAQPGSLRSSDEPIDTGHAPIRARCRSHCPTESLRNLSLPAG